PQEPPARRCVSLSMGTPRRAGAPFGLPAQASTGGQFWTPIGGQYSTPIDSFTRLTNAFSKKAEAHYHMVALYTVWYNLVRIHKALRCSPAMAAGVCAGLWEMPDIAALIDARTDQPRARGPYKPRQSQLVQISN
ncbi:MAG: hypothetical protein ACRELF_09235, partial [Gemmataceae bacterium]